MPTNIDLVSIRVVEQETGISKDLLRIWEKRYGFPEPTRIEDGDRLYDVQQIDRLKTLKKLVDAGHRPGSIIKLDDAGLAEVAAKTQIEQSTVELSEDIVKVLDILSSNNSLELKDFLLKKLLNMGVKSFVLEFMTPLNHAIGNAWFAGKLPLFHEHYYTKQIQSVLVAAVLLIKNERKPPIVVSATITGEQHTLSIEMVEVILALGGATTISLGPQVPYSEIVGAIKFYAADIIALSFSSYFTHSASNAVIKKLAADLPSTTEIWAGGGSIRSGETAWENVRLFTALDEITGALEDWRKKRV